ncbi:hypothetical protein KUM39_24120 [Streptomyces sp. J2-1]|uniref:hypothetical protein n=1 Tax=Streptomyces corallincola TaxID=2851888 RepID=UPI001C38D963|nr:hypothetical protein [Streptomyces corallincola]MBV2357412.1 hypothetical protein [Streptomyces corallincola]
MSGSSPILQPPVGATAPARHPHAAHPASRPLPTANTVSGAARRESAPTRRTRAREVTP